MKIGILTLHNADSYGAVLQAYALQRTLKSLGAESAFLSFEDNRQPGASESAAGDDPQAGPLIRRIRLMGERRSALFADFRKKYLICAPPCPQSEAEGLNCLYDCFIAGSDQIWNLRIPGVDGRYFLPFAKPDKRYSYAASFGTEELPGQVQKWCAGQLTKFRGLSVREESGRKLIRDLTGRDAVVCLDPTLLLSPEEWEELTDPFEGPPYVLLFLLKNDARLVKEAEEIAGRKNLVLRVVTGPFLPQFGFEPWTDTNVNRWLSLIRYAECVFANSFHGAVFSLLFGRPMRISRLTGSLADRNGRIEELLQSTGTAEAFEKLSQPLPAGLFAKRTEEKRQVSMDYLRGIISNETIR